MIRTNSIFIIQKRKFSKSSFLLDRNHQSLSSMIDMNMFNSILPFLILLITLPAVCLARTEQNLNNINNHYNDTHVPISSILIKTGEQPGLEIAEVLANHNRHSRIVGYNNNPLNHISIIRDPHNHHTGSSGVLTTRKVPFGTASSTIKTSVRKYRQTFGQSSSSSSSSKNPFVGQSNNLHYRLHRLTLTSSSSSSSSSPSTLSPGSSNTMKYQTDHTCRSNCSGHGDCYNGTCFCEVEYSGGTCDHPNFKYYISFSTVYYMICVVSFIQLMLCINSEIARQKPRCIRRAFRINIQKALYFLICIATAIRGYYFSSPSHVQLACLISAYYPILMSGSSLLVCFWAEVFHLDVSLERSRFLSKSFFGFILFNAITYSMYLAEMVLLYFYETTETDKDFFLNIFNSIYAFLMLVVVTFFLIYGVEVYFKVRGAFAAKDSSCSADISQLQQSRLGLISQAVLLLVTIVFLLSEVFGAWWKDKVPVFSRNYHQIMFRVVEFGVALWFPCVLWNCIQPEQLWILNPRRILKRRIETKNNMINDDDMDRLKAEKMGKSVAESEYLVGGGGASGQFDPSKIPECWICYETEITKPEAGPMIQPCACRGDVSAVHHSCLLRWLMESCSTSTAPVSCKVCGNAYKVEQSNETVWLPAGLTIAHWFKTATIITIMFCTLGGSMMIVKIFQHMYVKMISVGSAILVEYICLRFLGFNMISAYHRAKISAIRIIGRRINVQMVNHYNNNNNNDDNSSKNNLNEDDGSINEHESTTGDASAPANSQILHEQIDIVNIIEHTSASDLNNLKKIDRKTLELVDFQSSPIIAFGSSSTTTINPSSVDLNDSSLP